MDSKNFSRVYINPNFNRSVVSSSSNKQHYSNMPHINAMHLNPNFSSTQNNKKIYINPNFIPLTPQPVHCIQQCSSKTDMNVPSLTGENLPANTVSVCDNIPAQMQVPVAKKSRYRLVRHNENKPPETTKTKPEKTESHTVKLTKYKSVRITDVKLNLEEVKQAPKQIKSSSKSMQSNSHILDQKQRTTTMNTYYNHKAFKTRYTYIKSKEIASNTPHKTFKTQFSYIKSKETPKRINTNRHTSLVMSVKNTPRSKIRKLKVKCNTPCRLFRKYGKCLRNAKGHCKYLHDKKHVSICRKFVKGICHDKDCLLSHELSDKKMPTCYFYLQGMCTKEGCPYLHVKVNEKAIVCPDFKKGYCERGNTCLYRHVETTKQSVHTKTKSTNQVKKRIIESFKSQNVAVQKTPNLPPVAEDQIIAVKDNRYYKEVIVDGAANESCQVIKPTRCKLGMLPAYIKL